MSDCACLWNDGKSFVGLVVAPFRALRLLNQLSTRAAAARERTLWQLPVRTTNSEAAAPEQYFWGIELAWKPSQHFTHFTYL